MIGFDVCTGDNCDLKLICQRYIDYKHFISIKEKIPGKIITKSSGSCKMYKHKAFYGE